MNDDREFTVHVEERAIGGFVVEPVDPVRLRVELPHGARHCTTSDVELQILNVVTLDIILRHHHLTRGAPALPQETSYGVTYEAVRVGNTEV